MKFKAKRYFILIIFSLIIYHISFASIDEDKFDKIENYVKNEMKFGKIPGLSIVVFDKDSLIFNKGFGYTDLITKKPVTSESLFEFGSNSEAFTALGILLLVKKGKINLNDPVQKYIPWLKMRYQGQEYSQTILQFLHHTSGVPINAIGQISISKDSNPLEKNVKTLVGQELESKPGSKFQYSAINYDVISLIIQNVAGISYEKFMDVNVLQALNFKNTYFYKNESIKSDLVIGYKMGFKQPLKYNVINYRGNSASGYLFISAEDLCKWISLQFNNVRSGNEFEKYIAQLHIPDTTIFSQYCTGWFYQKKLSKLEHGSTSPNFSSYIEFDIKHKIGVGILANINSNYTKEISDGIFNICLDVEPGISVNSDFNQKLDRLSIIVLYISTPILFIILWRIFKNIYKTKIITKKSRSNKILLFTLFAVLFTIFLCLLYSFPRLIGFDFPWNYIYIWSPVTFIYAVFILFLLGTGTYFNILLAYVFN